MPGNDTGLYGELRALIRLDRHDEARTLIRETLETSPTNPAALIALADLGRRLGRYDEALTALDAVIAPSQPSFNLLAMRAELRVRAGDAEGARADFATLRAMAEGAPTLMNTVCWNQAVVGFDLDQALIDCDVAVSTGEASMIDSRALVLLQLGRYEESRAAYDQALAARPTQAPSLYGRGLARLALGDAGGREDVDHARRLDPEVAKDFTAFEARRPDLLR